MSSSSNFEPEWLKLILDEVAKRNEQTNQSIQAVEKRINRRLDCVDKHQADALQCQKDAQKEHERMNNILDEHIRRTEANEKLLEILKDKMAHINEQVDPVVREYENKQVISNVATKKLKKLSLIVGTTVGVLTAVVYTLQILEVF